MMDWIDQHENIAWLLVFLLVILGTIALAWIMANLDIIAKDDEA